jgi:hypothetical protein
MDVNSFFRCSPAFFVATLFALQSLVASHKFAANKWKRDPLRFMQGETSAISDHIVLKRQDKIPSLSNVT